MRAVFLLFDSLNRHLLGPYGGARIPTPNFDRLAKKSLTFDNHYVGSMPCMPARRDMQTGRLSFLHRSWGPLEPFDNSFPELLAEKGIYSHLVTDHAHYFEDGGATYHTRYDSFEFIRGQEGDAWKAMVQPPWERLREQYHERQYSEAQRSYFRKNMVNREYIRSEANFPSVKCFKAGLEFLETNHEADNWLLQLETFDPHEPFTAPERFKDAFKGAWDGPIRDWPRYARVDELPAECEELRANYYALIALCDHLLGTVLDVFDAHNMWENTALILTTDHGYLLGEHDFWAKNRMTMYEEVAHIPLFVHHPGHAKHAGEHRKALTQNMDIAATFVDMFQAERPPEMQAHSLLQHMDGDVAIREAVLFGYFGGAVNLADGTYTYHRYPPDLSTQEIYQYTLMPTHIWTRFSPEELAPACLSEPMPFTKGVPLLKVRMTDTTPIYDNYGPGCLLEDETRLYDIVNDPGQETPLHDAGLEARLTAIMAGLMAENDAPPEAFTRIQIA
ncbi:MAG: sulfatase, partial [Geminicoccaceae bacterium]